MSKPLNVSLTGRALDAVTFLRGAGIKLSGIACKAFIAEEKKLRVGGGYLESHAEYLSAAQRECVAAILACPSDHSPELVRWAFGEARAEIERLAALELEKQQ